MADMTTTPPMTKTPEAVARSLSEAQRRAWTQQEQAWPRHLAGARGGNPWATLCDHCCGRHAPPRDHLCPHPSLRGDRARHYLPIELHLDRLLLAEVRDRVIPNHTQKRAPELRTILKGAADHAQ